MNKMNTVKLDKITLNIGVGEAGEKLEKRMKILEELSGTKVIKTKAKKRIPTWNVRPGMEIGAKVTLRGKNAEKTLKILLKAVDNTLKPKNFDKQGNFSFGIKEYIDVKEIQYNPKLGIFGFDVAVTLKKPGYRVAQRKIKKSKIGKKQLVTKEEAQEFIKKMGVTVE
ncbi:MAG: 50S ribosomal protein L5 [Nanoarchaeota archaeon]|nr:50S ribosomal protein L5 [Nanoarchaeota archaeon]